MKKNEGKLLNKLKRSDIEAWERVANERMVVRKKLVAGKWVKVQLYDRIKRKTRLVYGKGRFNGSAEVDVEYWARG